MKARVGAIHPPIKPDNIPLHSKWLLGEVRGTWFCIDKVEARYRIRRFTPIGELDCDRIFKIEEQGLAFDLEQHYEFAQVSHCSKCRIKQGNTTFVFNYIEN